jgi:hypothetical protein
VYQYRSIKVSRRKGGGVMEKKRSGGEQHPSKLSRDSVARAYSVAGAVYVCAYESVCFFVCLCVGLTEYLKACLLFA